MGKYDDIINLPHHVSDYHKPMTMIQRAAQFSPFAALSGHEDAIAEVRRTTEPFREMSDEEKNRISNKLFFAIKNHAIAKITYFTPDKLKKGGFYNTVTGKIKKREEYDNLLIMLDGTIIPIDFICEIKVKDSSHRKVE